MKKITLTVIGMMCGGCAATVVEAVLKVSGVKSATVDIKEHSLIVKYDESVTNPEVIASAVKASGYEPQL